MAGKPFDCTRVPTMTFGIGLASPLATVQCTSTALGCLSGRQIGQSANKEVRGRNIRVTGMQFILRGCALAALHLTKLPLRSYIHATDRRCDTAGALQISFDPKLANADVLLSARNTYK